MRQKKWLDRYTKDEFLTAVAPIAVSEYRVNRDFNLHGHDFFEMELILNGSGKQRLNGTKFNLTRGSLFLLAPTDFHEVRSDPAFPLLLINIKFAESLIDNELRDILCLNTQPLVAMLHDEALASMETDCRRLIQESRENLPGKRLIIRSTLERMLIDLFRSAVSTVSDPPGNNGRNRSEWPAIRQALRYIDEHFREQVTLKDAAVQSGWTSSHFSETFHLIVGISFQKYLAELRLQYSRKLLLNSTLPVTEVGMASGYNSLPYFIRSFKIRFGLSPGAARKLKNHVPSEDCATFPEN